MREIVTLPLHHSVTIGNWNTTSTLLRMMEGAGEVSARR